MFKIFVFQVLFLNVIINIPSLYASGGRPTSEKSEDQSTSSARSAPREEEQTTSPPSAVPSDHAAASSVLSADNEDVLTQARRLQGEDQINFILEKTGNYPDRRQRTEQELNNLGALQPLLWEIVATPGHPYQQKFGARFFPYP